MPLEIQDYDFTRADSILLAINSNGLDVLRGLIAQAIATERERCAQVAEHLNGWGTPPNPELARHIAMVIRNDSPL